MSAGRNGIRFRLCVLTALAIAISNQLFSLFGRPVSGNPESNGSTFTPEFPPLPEPSELVKEEVKQRDKYRCLCCKETKRHLLVIDHIKPKYYGADHFQHNLQTLCRTCNTIKGIETVNFRIDQTPLNAPKAG